jgi:hypothetical protein
MWYSNGQQFSTRDHDNDAAVSADCAEIHHGAWWFNYCANANLNGVYGAPGLTGPIYNRWFRWENNGGSLKGSTMMVRPKT